jgi:hypothetical protein
MKQHIRMAVFGTVALAAAVPVAAAAAPNFDGKWVRETAQSNVAPYPNFWLVRAPAPTGGGYNQPVIMQVQQSGGSVQVTDNIHPQRTYTLDGRAHSMPTDTRLAQVQTTATMQGDTMTISMVQPYSGMPGNVPMRSKETWTTSSDGKTLTVITVRDLPAQRQVFSEVYTRQ